MKTIICLTVFAVLLVLGSVSLGVGQSHSGPLYTSQIVQDGQCYWDGTNCGTSGTECQSIDITVANEGTYYLHAWVDCVLPQTPCGGCYACAFLKRVSDGQVMAGIQTPCENPCASNPDPATSSSLVPGVSYRLYVCKKPCDPNHSCSTCETECIAKALIHG